MAYPGIFFGVGGGSTNSVEDRGQRERGSGGSSPPSQRFWRQLYFGTRNLISYSKIFLIFWYFKSIYDDNQFIFHC